MRPAAPVHCTLLLNAHSVSPSEGPHVSRQPKKTEVIEGKKRQRRFGERKMYSRTVEIKAPVWTESNAPLLE